MLQHIRPATENDLARIAEIIITNYRLTFYPIFKSDEFYFGELTVPTQMEVYREALGNLWVYDDGVVKGVLHAEGREVKKLFVEPVLQGNGIGAALAAEYGLKYLHSDFKKKNGYRRSVELSDQYGLYRQDFCGCVFSKMERERARREKNAD